MAEIDDTGAAGSRALAKIGEALAHRPQKDEAALSAAMRSLCAFRDMMIAKHRSAPLTREDRTRMSQINAVISTVLAVHFPLGEVQWGELEKARGWLATIIRAEAAG